MIIINKNVNVFYVDNGGVIAFGSNSHGQLGLPEVQLHTISPLVIPSKVHCIVLPMLLHCRCSLKWFF